MKKLEMNENWELEEVNNIDAIFVVLLKHGSFDQGYVEASSTDDILMQDAYNNLVAQYNDCGCDEQTKIYLIKVPNTKQTNELCNTGLFNGSSCDPHVIEATRDLFNRADCEPISCWTGCGLTESKKKKKTLGGYITITTGDPALNIKHFNKCMGTDGLGEPYGHTLVVGDTLPDGPIATTADASDAGNTGGDAGTGEGGAVGESLNEAKIEASEKALRELIEKEYNEDKSKIHIFETDMDEDGIFTAHFDDEDVDFSHLQWHNLSDEEKENGRPCCSFMLSGGLNGPGEWTDYLGDIKALFEKIKKELGLHAIIYEGSTDILDDLWDIKVFLYHDSDLEETKESLTEDLIVIEPEEAKDKLYELKAQIENCDDPKVRKNLLVLMNVYLFQTFFGGMPRSSDERDALKPGEDEMIHSDLTKAE